MVIFFFKRHLPPRESQNHLTTKNTKKIKRGGWVELEGD